MADVLSRFTLRGNQDTTQKYTYSKGIMSDINDTEELLEGNFPIILNLTNQYQQKELSLLTKYKEGTYQTGSFCGVINININLIKCDDKIIIPSIL